MVNDIDALLERVKAATGPDRELDGAIEVQARRFLAYAVGLNDETRAKWQHNGATVFDGNTGYEAGRFTASIDAALALTERVLPGHSMLLGYSQTAETLPWARIGIWSAPDATAATIPLAIIAATISALINRGAEQ